MKKTTTLLIFTVLLSACTKKGTDILPPEETPNDTIALADTVDSIEVNEAPVPKAADLVFNDFIDNFMNSKSFQTKRVNFPLEYDAFGEKTLVQKKQWQFDSLYANQEVFLMLFPNETALENRNTVNDGRVEVQQFNFSQDLLKQYSFSKAEGLWKLSSIKEEKIEDNPNHEFFSFYKQFASDSIFRQSHIQDPFTLIFQDDDTFSPVEGVASPEQWSAYAPELPVNQVTNVNFNQTLSDMSKVVLMLGTQNGSMSSTLTFRRKEGEWKLVKLENN